MGSVLLQLCHTLDGDLKQNCEQMLLVYGKAPAKCNCAQVLIALLCYT